MKSKKINNIRIPISFLLVFVFLQLLFFSFKDIPLSRHPLDELVYNLNFSKENGKIILLGDSITYDVAKRYQIGKKNQIINLTTNQASGLVGSYFLLKRYFNKVEDRNPKHVIIISTPEFLNFIPKDHTAKLYLQSVFQQEDEAKYLKLLNVYQNEVNSLIHFIDIKRRIIEPLFGLIKNKKTTLFINGLNPSDFEKLESSGGNEVSIDKIIDRAKIDITLSENSQHVISNICELSMKKNFKLHLVVSPIPETAYFSWQQKNKINKIKKSILKNKSKFCKNINFFDINQITKFPDHAFRDTDHLRSPGWASKFAKEINKFVDELN
tara:strand:+ start:2848 stop:3822 length:975 start_codon:yes stop_codon:yes gene_type:complete